MKKILILFTFVMSVFATQTLAAGSVFINEYYTQLSTTGYELEFEVNNNWSNIQMFAVGAARSDHMTYYAWTSPERSDGFVGTTANNINGNWHYTNSQQEDVILYWLNLSEQFAEFDTAFLYYSEIGSTLGIGVHDGFYAAAYMPCSPAAFLDVNNDVFFTNTNEQPAPVPLPSSLLLFFTGLASFVLAKRNIKE